MEELLDIARTRADSCEVYYTSNEENHIHFENYALTTVRYKMQSGYSLRLIKDGLIGTSYTKNLLDNRETLVENAVDSLMGRVKADFSFPKGHQPEDLRSYDSRIVGLTSQKIIDELKTTCKYVQQNCRGQLNIDSGCDTTYIRIMNTHGLDVERKGSSYYAYPMLLFPNSYASICSLIYSTGFEEIPESELDRMTALYSKALSEVSPKPGNVQVIFSQDTMYTLMWRVSEGTSAKSIYEGISPIKEKVGERIFSEKLTIVDDPHITADPSARGFDDEGTPTSRFLLVDKGVLMGFFNNLDYAAKLKMRPTGHGYKKVMWGGETISLSPMPKLTNLCILPGSISLEDMIKGIKRGVLVMGALGAHSGNIPNGDFSIGLNPGLYIENGEIRGRIKDGMISGNIYDIMKRVSSIEDQVHWAHGGKFPALCFDDVKFSTRQS